MHPGGFDHRSLRDAPCGGLAIEFGYGLWTWQGIAYKIYM